VSASLTGYNGTCQKFEFLWSETFGASFGDFNVYQNIAPVSEAAAGKIVAVCQAIKLSPFVASMCIGFAEKKLTFEKNFLIPVEITTSFQFIALFGRRISGGSIALVESIVATLKKD